MPDLRIIDPDARFFDQHKDRKFHIRPANREEFSREFASLGGHNPDRRVVLLALVDPLTARMINSRVMKIPFLLKSDESISDDDATLRPIIHEIMVQAANDHGMDPYQ